MTFKEKTISITESLAEMLILKNEKYGNSALEPVRVFSKASPQEQILVRLDDKLSRLRTQHISEDEDVLDDLIGYLILLKIANNQIPTQVYDKYTKENLNEPTTAPTEGIKADADNSKEARVGPAVGGTEKWKDPKLPPSSEAVQERTYRDPKERSARCDTSMLVNEDTSNGDELSRGSEATEGSEVRPVSYRRSSQMGGRVSEILYDLEGFEKVIAELRHDIQLGYPDSRNVCQSLSDVSVKLRVTVEKIRNLQ